MRVLRSEVVVSRKGGSRWRPEIVPTPESFCEGWLVVSAITGDTSITWGLA